MICGLYMIGLVYIVSRLFVLLIFYIFAVLEQNLNCEGSSVTERILSFNFLSLALNQHSILGRKTN